MTFKTITVKVPSFSFTCKTEINVTGNKTFIVINKCDAQEKLDPLVANAIQKELNIKGDLQSSGGHGCYFRNTFHFQQETSKS